LEKNHLKVNLLLLIQALAMFFVVAHLSGSHLIKRKKSSFA